VVLSVSLDSDEQKWKDFIAKNEMTWLHYRDGGFTGPISKMFGVESIPHTFTIDADGVLQDEQIGDASIEGKLKKLEPRAGTTGDGEAGAVAPSRKLHKPQRGGVHAVPVAGGRWSIIEDVAQMRVAAFAGD